MATDTRDSAEGSPSARRFEVGLGPREAGVVLQDAGALLEGFAQVLGLGVQGRGERRQDLEGLEAGSSFASASRGPR